MIARVLCPGPSLAAYEGDGFAGPVIGVNRVPTAWACDWWACIDYPTVLMNFERVKGKPNLLTNRTTAAEITVHDVLMPGEVRHIESLFDLWPRAAVAYSIFSATSGAVLAAALGATVVEVYGCDLAGTLDWDGVAAGNWRTDQRWKSEGELWRQLQTMLAGRGVELTFKR